MDLRQTDSDKAKNALMPDSLKSKSELNKEHVVGGLDTAASYIPGQHKTTDHLSDHKRDHPITHDAGRAGLGDQISHALKPNQSETIGDKTQKHVDNAASSVQPESDKGVGQKTMDVLNPQKDATHHHDGTTTGAHAAGAHPTGTNQGGVIQGVKDAIHNITHPGDNHGNTGHSA